MSDKEIKLTDNSSEPESETILDEPTPVRPEDNLEQNSQLVGELSYGAQTRETFAPYLEEGVSEPRDVGNNYMDILRNNPDTNFARTNQLVHDVARLESADQAFDDIIDNFKYKKQYSRKLTALEANQLAKDLGEDIKWEHGDYGLTEGDVRFAVDQKKKEDALKEELAFFQETGDYTALQNARLLASSITGAVGPKELAAMTALSIAGAPLWAEGASKISAAVDVKSATQAAKLLYSLHKEDLYSKGASAVVNMAKDYQEAYKLAKATKVSKDNLALTFALDGIATDLPRVGLVSLDSDLKKNGSFDTKDALTELLMVGVGSAALGAGVQTLQSKLVEQVANNINKEATQVVKEATLAGNTKTVEKVVKDTQEVQETVAKTFEESMPKVNSEAAQRYINQVSQCSKLNLTDEEVIFMTEELYRRAKAGLPLNVLDKMPFRTTYYSNLPGCYNSVKAVAQNNLSDAYFYRLMRREGWNPEYKGVKPLDTEYVQRVYKTAQTMKHENPAGFTKQAASLDEVNGFLDKLEPVSVHFAEEGGALGRTAVKGLTKAQTERIHVNILKSLMMEGTPEGKAAADIVNDELSNLVQARDMAKEIVQTYQDIITMNNAAREAGKAPAFPYRMQNQYLLLDGSFGTLPDALADLAYLLAPAEIREQFFKSGREYFKSIKEANLTGKKFVSPEVLTYKAISDEWVKNVTQKFGTFEKSKKTGKLYFNLKHQEGAIASETDTRYLKALMENLDSIVKDDMDLLKTNEIFAKEYSSDPQKLISMIETGTDVPELGYSYSGSPVSNLSVEQLLKDEEGVLGRLTAAKAKVEAYKGTDAEKSVTELLDIMKKQATGSKQTRLYETQLANNEKELEVVDHILQYNFSGERTDIINEIQKSGFFNKITDTTLVMTPYSISKLLRREKASFRKIINNAIFGPIKEEIPGGLVSSKLDDAFDEAVDNYITKLQDMKSDAFGKLTADTSVDLGGDVKAQLAKKAEQKQAYDEILQPLVKELGIAAANYQTSLLNTKALTMELWSRCLKYPGRMDEVILGSVSGNFHAMDKGAVSIEKMAGTQKEYITFMNKMMTLKVDRNMQSVEKYAYNPQNFEMIRDSIFDRMLLEEGRLLPEEEQAFQAGTQAGQVAQAFLDTVAGLRNDLINVGAGNKRIVSLYDSKKLRNAASFMTGSDYIQSPLYQLCHGAAQLLEDSTKGKVAQQLTRFLPASGEVPDMGRANLALYMLDNLDLDAMFNTKGASKISLNEVRDILTGTTTLTTGNPIDDLFAKYPVKDLNKAIDMITDGIQGKPNAYGLIDQLANGSRHMSAEFAGQKSKYLEDLDFRLKFKNNTVEKESLKYWGYEDMKQLFEGNIGSAKKAYAVLSTAGAEPFQFYTNMKELARTYVDHVAPHKYSAKETKLLQERISSASFDKQLNYLVNNVCGTYSSPATTMNKIARTIVQTAGAPLIMASAFKGITDYAYAFQYLVSAGAYQGLNLGARAKVYSKALGFLTPNSKYRKLASNMLVSQQLGLNTLYEAMTNGESLTMAGGAIKDIAAGFQGKGLGKYSTKIEKAENIAKSWTNTVMGLGGVSQAAEYNRTMAALTTMQAIGDFGNVAYKDMNPRLQITLKRYGIDEFEWDNIFTKKGIMDSDAYMTMTQGEGAEIFGEGKMFIPDLIMQLDDKFVADMMKAQPNKFNLVSPDTIASYRNNLVDKACMIINTSADEMSSIPNSRIRGFLLGYNDPNTRTGAMASMLTQFQSFGASMNWYSWTRRWMAFADPEDMMLTNFIMGRNGWGAPTASMVGFISELAMAQWLINEGLAGLTGKSQKITDDSGAIQGDRVAKKLGKALVDQAGLAGIVLDTVMGLAGTGAGSGGGLAVPVAPVPASTLYGAVKVGKAMARDENEGKRMKAGLAQVGLNTMETLGIARHPLLQATYNRFIGDKLNEIAVGPKAWAERQKRRLREGFRGNYMYDVTDWVSDHFTN